jgi:hypothetical protein
VAEEMWNPNNLGASATSADHHPGVPAPTVRPIDMSVFEASIAELPDLPDLPGAAELTDRRSVVPQPRQPSVEWASVWADGRLTTVETEAAARFVAACSPATRVAGRIVGRWGSPDLP